jgi:tetratricopeptide (TPR) repeat protein
MLLINKTINAISDKEVEVFIKETGEFIPEIKDVFERYDREKNFRKKLIIIGLMDDRGDKALKMVKDGEMARCYFSMCCFEESEKYYAKILCNHEDYYNRAICHLWFRNPVLASKYALNANDLVPAAENIEVIKLTWESELIRLDDMDNRLAEVRYSRGLAHYYLFKYIDSSQKNYELATKNFNDILDNKQDLASFTYDEQVEITACRVELDLLYDSRLRERDSNKPIN